MPGRPVIANCGTPTEKVSEFLDHHLKLIRQNGLSYISVPENAILVTADVSGFISQYSLSSRFKGS